MDFLISPMVNGLLFFYSILGQSFPLAIVVTTIIVRLFTLPLTLPQQRSFFRQPLCFWEIFTA